MDEQLKPCPFCGNRNELEIIEGARTGYAVKCDNCRTKVPLSRWNSRNCEAKLKKHIKALEGRVEVQTGKSRPVSPDKVARPKQYLDKRTGKMRDIAYRVRIGEGHAAIVRQYAIDNSLSFAGAVRDFVDMAVEYMYDGDNEVMTEEYYNEKNI